MTVQPPAGAARQPGAPGQPGARATLESAVRVAGARFRVLFAAVVVVLGPMFAIDIAPGFLGAGAEAALVDDRLVTPVGGAVGGSMLGVPAMFLGWCVAVAAGVGVAGTELSPRADEVFGAFADATPRQAQFVVAECAEPGCQRLGRRWRINHAFLSGEPRGVVVVTPDRRALVAEMVDRLLIATATLPA